MADSELVELLRAGVAHWNTKRPRNVDLSRAKLKRVQMSGINLSNANLRGADLSWADLRKADLSDCDLRTVDLRRADLSGAKLCGARFNESNLRNAKFTQADLSCSDLSEVNGNGARFSRANLNQVAAYKAQFADAKFTSASMVDLDADSSGFRRTKFMRANLTGAWLGHSDLTDADMRGAILIDSVLYDAKLSGVNLTSANLSRADLRRSMLVETTITDCILTGSSVYGISVWEIKGVPTAQRNLAVLNHPPDDPAYRLPKIIGALELPQGEEERSTRHPWPSGRLAIASTYDPQSSAEIRVDDLEVAQLVHLLLSREKLRNIIQTITSKAVLILGRFTPERKAVLDAIADALRSHSLIPIIFDFERATSKDFTETIKTLAGLSLFVIADITNPKSAPLELEATVPDYQIPFIPVMQDGEKQFSMFTDLRKYDWVARLLTYTSLPELMKVFKVAILDEAFKLHATILQRKAEALKPRTVEDYIHNHETSGILK